MVDRDRIIAGIANIPKDLQDLKTWCGFTIDDKGNVIKKPLSIIDYKGLGVNDTDRLVDFNTAVEALKLQRVAVLGVGLVAGGNITCIDIDCHEDYKKEKFKEINKELLEKFNSYAETSISGMGTHIFIRAKKPSGYKHTDRYGIIEVYDTNRFMIVTGDKIEGHGIDIEDYQQELAELCEKHLVKQAQVINTIGQDIYDIEDTKVVEKIGEFKKGKLFLENRWEEVKRLDNDSKEYIQAYPGQSEADFAFVMLILYTNGNNPEQAERIFKKSAMWDKDRQAKKSSGYVKHIITEASLRCNKVYDWKKVEYSELEQTIDFEEVIEQQQQNNLMLLAQQNLLQFTDNRELNSYIHKYILNFGTGYKTVNDTSLGDYDNATMGIRFAMVNNSDLIYLAEGKEWLKWTGKYWERCYDRDLLNFAVKVFNQLKHEAYNISIQSLYELDLSMKLDLEEKAIGLFKFASTKKNQRNCMEMIEFSKAYFIQNQEHFNIDKIIHSNKNVINLSNGTFDFEKMVLLPHSKEFYQTKITQVEYIENAKAPQWEKFLEKILPNENIRNYLKKAVGYTICSSYMEKCMFIMYGEDGNNGKTTIANILLKLIGDYGVTISPATIMENYSNKNNGPRPDLLKLRDRRFVSVSEAEKNDKLSEGLIKSLTGGGYISCRTLHQEPVQFVTQFKIWLDTNYKPTVRGTDLAIWGRLRIIPFDIVIPDSEIDRSLGEKMEQELSGILNWAIEGYSIYKVEGLEVPTEMDILIKEYAEDMSSLDQWFKECITILEPTAAKKNHKCYTSKELYQSYKEWCEFNGEYNWTQRKFTQELNKKEPCKEVKKVQGYIKYLAIQLNELGQLCYDRQSKLPLPFANEYNKIIHKIISDQEKREKIQKAFGSGDIRLFEELLPQPIIDNNPEDINEEVKPKSKEPDYYIIKE